MTPDWFTTLTGLPEHPWSTTQAHLEVSGNTLRSRANGRTFAIGTFSTPSVAELRALATQTSAPPSVPLRVSTITADVTALHLAPEHHGAVFQVASQFNCLEMTGPSVAPEDGVTRYANDHTQGPACAIAAGAATIYRNYFVPVEGVPGQTRHRQIDCLRDVGAVLHRGAMHSGVRPHSGPGQTSDALWTMRNGYALCTPAQLTTINTRLAATSPGERDAVRDRLRVGVHHDVQVTAPGASAGQRVTQVFCSAMPVAYAPAPHPLWAPFASLVLDGAYEATLWAAVLHAARGGSNVVFLTQLGGGAFGNDPAWILGALRRALQLVRTVGLDVRIVTLRTPSAELQQLVHEFA